MSLGLIVIIILVVLLLGSAGDFYYSGSFPHALGGGLGLVFTLLLILWIFGAFRSMR
jgi:hypothetical protein